MSEPQKWPEDYGPPEPFCSECGVRIDPEQAGKIIDVGSGFWRYTCPPCDQRIRADIIQGANQVPNQNEIDQNRREQELQDAVDEYRVKFREADEQRDVLARELKKLEQKLEDMQASAQHYQEAATAKAEEIVKLRRDRDDLQRRVQVLGNAQAKHDTDKGQLAEAAELAMQNADSERRRREQLELRANLMKAATEQAVRTIEQLWRIIQQQPEPYPQRPEEPAE